MQVILLEKIRNLGALGEEVRVKAGFARNFLIPQGKAVPANAENKKKFEERRAELEKHQADELAKAQARAAQICGMTLQVVRKVSEEGKLFGSVSTRDIADAFKEAGVEVEKSEIHLASGPLREVGDHEIPITLHGEIDCKVIVSVIGEP